MGDVRQVTPFLSQGTQETQQAWLKALTIAMPLYDFVAFEALSIEARAAAEVAVVANPDPLEVAQLPNLKWVQSLWAGVETLLNALPNNDLKIVRLVDPSLSETMTEAVLAWTLYLHRDMHHYRAQQSKALWHQRDYVAAGQKTIGVLGMGHLGRMAAQRLCTNGFNVMGWSRSPALVDGVAMLSGDEGLTQVLGSADIIVILLPLTPETNGLLSEVRLGQMKQGASVINFARGPILDTAALIGALDQNHLDHAVLDVFDQEPLPSDSPLWTHPDITILPHISAPTNKVAAAKVVGANLDAFFQDGTIPAFVERDRGY
jgi:glyoxylate/hydroxypyruvate reductase